jgi:hypothetical protein
MKIKEKLCPYCGANMNPQHHNLNRNLAVVLLKLYNAPKNTGKFSRLELTHTQINNAQKLKYWDLVLKIKGTDYWKISTKGIQFVDGSRKMFERVITFRNKRIRFEGDLILFKNIRGNKIK